ncbi:B3 DNA binding domain - like 10 [Theobroma cacao]|nr:B3 DNA binding domain - like 10 [Theobroma cacao]
MAVFSKLLTETDVEKRLSAPTQNKKCFLDFGNQHQVLLKVVDENDKVWRFVCSIRKQGHPKQVLSQGWLPFVRRWKLAIGDRVLLHKIQDKAGKGLYRIEVIERAKQSPGVLSPSILNHDGDSTMRNFGKEPTGSTVTSHSNDQAMTYNQTERLNDLPITDRVGSKMVEFICLKPHVQVKEPKFIDFFELVTRLQRKRYS